MKTIVHIVLSDLERNHLAQVWDDRPTKRLVTRNEVTDRVQKHIQEELAQYVFNKSKKVEPGTGAPVKGTAKGQPDRTGDLCLPGNNPWESDNVDEVNLERACKRVLYHIALGRDDGTWNPGYVESLIRAQGVTE